MAAKFPEFDILALALAPLDLPMQDLDDQEDFALSKKENEERFGAPVRDNDLARAIEERIPDKRRRPRSGRTVYGRAGAKFVALPSL